MAGLQDIAPIVANRWVTSAVWAPMRAAAAAASQPAWPPPTTMTSNRVRTFGSLRRGLLTYRGIFVHFSDAPDAGMFHVKQGDRSGRPPLLCHRLLPDTKVP